MLNFFKEAITPDPTKHRNISFVKSALRIVAGLNLIFLNFLGAGIFLILAELLGVYEELV